MHVSDANCSCFECVMKRNEVAENYRQRTIVDNRRRRALEVIRRALRSRPPSK